MFFHSWNGLRVLVKSKGKDSSGSLKGIVGSSCFAVHLRREVLPWVSVVVPKNRNSGGEAVEVRDDGRSGSRTRCSVSQSTPTLQTVVARLSCLGGKDQGREEVVIDNIGNRSVGGSEKGGEAGVGGLVGGGSGAMSGIRNEPNGMGHLVVEVALGVGVFLGFGAQVSKSLGRTGFRPKA